MTGDRMAPERLVKLREYQTGPNADCGDCHDLIYELDAVTRERAEWEKRANSMADYRDDWRAYALHLASCSTCAMQGCEKCNEAKPLRLALERQVVSATSSSLPRPCDLRPRGSLNAVQGVLRSNEVTE